MRPFRTIAYSLVCLGIPFCGNAAVELNILSAPASFVADQDYEVTFSYTRDSDTEERRLVFLLDFRNPDTDVLVHQEVLGALTGLAQDTVPFAKASVTAPPDYNGPVYTTLTAAPWSINRALVAQMESYPTDGTYTYDWSISRPGDYGVTQDVVYQGYTVCPDYPGNTTYCSGVAFETFIVGWNNYNAQYGHTAIPSLSLNEINSFRSVWYGTSANAEKLAAEAIPSYGIGIEITDLEEFQRGDSLQLWRTSGSGHNPIFIEWVRNDDEEIIGLRYWGSQGSTNGIGINTEYFTGHGGTVRYDRIYAARARKPRDAADYEWALGSVTNKGPLPDEGWGLY